MKIWTENIPFTVLSFFSASSTTYSDVRCPPVLIYSPVAAFHWQLLGKQKVMAMFCFFSLSHVSSSFLKA